MRGCRCAACRRDRRRRLPGLRSQSYSKRAKLVRFQSSDDRAVVDRDFTLECALARIAALDASRPSADVQAHPARRAVALAHANDDAVVVVGRLARDDEHGRILAREEPDARRIRVLAPGVLERADSGSRRERRERPRKAVLAAIGVRIRPERAAQERESHVRPATARGCARPSRSCRSRASAKPPCGPSTRAKRCAGTSNFARSESGLHRRRAIERAVRRPERCVRGFDRKPILDAQERAHFIPEHGGVGAQVRLVGTERQPNRRLSNRGGGNGRRARRLRCRSRPDGCARSASRSWRRCSTLPTLWVGRRTHASTFAPVTRLGCPGRCKATIVPSRRTRAYRCAFSNTYASSSSRGAISSVRNVDLRARQERIGRLAHARADARDAFVILVELAIDRRDRRPAHDVVKVAAQQRRPRAAQIGRQRRCEIRGSTYRNAPCRQLFGFVERGFERKALRFDVVMRRPHAAMRLEIQLTRRPGAADRQRIAMLSNHVRALVQRP